ncbi:hypothetical protein M0R72_12970 [Candidatus Pacearchaeota archaeon]|jgi:hypothetical protein|nr:hypothetical protein [Candidatus Pacearchaeota archaeon]
MKRWLIIGLLVLGLAALSCRPLEIISVNVVDDNCECACVSWETNQDAQCKITYCSGDLCYTSPLEPEFSTFHSYGLPGSTFKMLMKGVTITAIGRDGQTCSEKVQWPGPAGEMP